MLFVIKGYLPMKIVESILAIDNGIQIMSKSGLRFRV